MSESREKYPIKFTAQLTEEEAHDADAFARRMGVKRNELIRRSLRHVRACPLFLAEYFPQATIDREAQP